MINKNIKASNIELTPDISNYLDKKLEALEKFTKDDDGSYVNAEIGKLTNKHKSGNIFFTELNFRIDNEVMRARAEGDSLIYSMDKAKDKALEILRERKGRKKDH